MSPPAPALPFTPRMPLGTERLLLRHVRPADLDDVFGYQSREDVCCYLPFPPRTREEVAGKLADWEHARTLAADDDFWQLAVERREAPGRVIGDVYFSLKSAESAQADIGWTLHPDHHGRGYMAEAASAVLDVAFRGVRLHRVRAVIDPRNIASAALCRRLGMRHEAHFAEDLWFKGEWGDTAVYGVLDREWEARRPGTSRP